MVMRHWDFCQIVLGLCREVLDSGAFLETGCFVLSIVILVPTSSWVSVSLSLTSPATWGFLISSGVGNLT